MLNYGEYLQLDQLLSSQTLESGKQDKPVHDEMLFIVIHQAYELWFKQILHEVTSIASIFQKDDVKDVEISTVNARFERVTKILALLVKQIDILETMTPMDFMEFRDYLTPASGFQSVQFRLLENALGMDRKGENQFLHWLKPNEREVVEQSTQQTSLFCLIEQWLERTPLLSMGDFSFWQAYQNAIEKMLEKDSQTIKNNVHLESLERETELKMLEKTKQKFAAILDKQCYDELLKDGHRKLSHKASCATLFIFLYREYPALQAPFKLITYLIEIDELIAQWRYRHVQMVQRMIGTKIGTGGSSGSDYLQRTIEHGKVFKDFTESSNFLIPRSELPTLPEELIEKLSLNYALLDAA